MKLRQDVHVWYLLSCGHTVRYLSDRIGNTARCHACPLDDWSKVFVLEIVYTKPYEIDE